MSCEKDNYFKDRAGKSSNEEEDTFNRFCASFKAIQSQRGLQIWSFVVAAQIRTTCPVWWPEPKAKLLRVRCPWSWNPPLTLWSHFLSLLLPLNPPWKGLKIYGYINGTRKGHRSVWISGFGRQILGPTQLHEHACKVPLIHAGVTAAPQPPGVPPERWEPVKQNFTPLSFI